MQELKTDCIPLCVVHGIIKHISGMDAPLYIYYTCSYILSKAGWLSMKGVILCKDIKAATYIGCLKLRSKITFYINYSKL